MGWRGALRSIGAISRQMEREARSRQREYEKLLKQTQRLEGEILAQTEVLEHENFLELLTTIHKDPVEYIDWVQIRNIAPPMAPNQLSTNELIAIDKLERYRPSFFDRLLRREDAKRLALNEALELARRADAEQNRESQRRYTESLSEWKQIHEIAIGVIQRDISAYLIASNKMEFFETISGIWASASLDFINPSLAQIKLLVNPSTIIPKYSKTFLKSGKVSIKDMPISKYWQMYQDYVCSSILRVAKEIMALLPIKMVKINTLTEMLNTRTGYFENTLIVSVLIHRRRLESLQMEHLDPSDAMDNFLTNMEFKKVEGFKPVDEVVIPTESKTKGSKVNCAVGP